MNSVGIQHTKVVKQSNYLKVKKMKLIAIFVFVAVAICGLASVAEAGLKEAAQCIQDALSYLAQGNIPDAVASLQAALRELGST